VELLLWRWSTAVQAVSLVLLTVFFALLARSVRLAEVGWWARAWACNLAALGATLVYWYFQPEGTVYLVVRAAYIAGKTAFVLLLIRGAWALKHPGDRPLPSRGWAIGLGVYSIVAAPFTTPIDRLGLVQDLVMGALLLAGAFLLFRKPRESEVGWLATGLLLRSLLALGEAWAHALQLMPDRVGPSLVARSGAFLAASSSFDSGVEWLVALGCVLALSERVQRELRRFNQELLTAQENLRRLADRDPLTALSNRRQLPEALRAFQPHGALFLFFDLDDFKEINDRYGHNVGDEWLRRFAAALGECFRPSDVLVRYGGDEFLVVASGLDDISGHERVARLREKLRAAPGGGPPVLFSVGVARLAPGGQPEEALKEADRSMYAAKSARRTRPAATRRA
jgi:diguanylate cyclase (GGDEF)-like protein